MKSDLSVSSALVRSLIAAGILGLAGVRSLVAQDATGSSLTPHEIDVLRGEPAGAVDQTATGDQQGGIPRRFHYNLTLNVRGVYDDNIFFSSVNKQSDFYFSIEPMISLSFGGDDSAGASSLNFIYRPGIFLFLDHSDEDTVQHLIRLSGSHNFGRLTLSGSQDVQILDGGDLNTLSDPTGHNANIDVAQRTPHNVYTTQISDSYILTGKLFLSNGARLAIDDYQSNFVSSTDLSTNLFLNYSYSEKLTAGLGGTFGYNTVDQGSPDQFYEQANLRLNYAATGKIGIGGSVGMEFRQFENDSNGTHVTPVFELDVSYRPFDGTSIGLTGSRRIENSASLSGQDYTDTNIHLTVNQRFMRRFTLGLALGYENSQYFSTFQGISATREDDYYYVQPTVDATIMRWWSAGVYYLFRKNASNNSDPMVGNFSFQDNQVGLRTTVTF